MNAKHTYQVGDKVLHSEFGEGLVVEIRDRPFFDILEVVFPDGVKRLTSIHPLLQPKPAVPDEPPPKPKRRRTPRPRGLFGVVPWGRAPRQGALNTG